MRVAPMAAVVTSASAMMARNSRASRSTSQPTSAAIAGSRLMKTPNALGEMRRSAAISSE